MAPFAVIDRTKLEQIGRLLFGQSYVLTRLDHASFDVDGKPLNKVAGYVHHDKGLTRIVLWFPDPSESGRHSLLHIFPFEGVVGHSANTPPDAVWAIGARYLIVRDTSWPIATLGQPMKSPFLPGAVATEAGKKMAFDVKSRCQTKACLVGAEFIPQGHWSVSTGL